MPSQRDTMSPMGSSDDTQPFSAGNGGTEEQHTKQYKYHSSGDGLDQSEEGTVRPRIRAAMQGLQRQGRELAGDAMTRAEEMADTRKEEATHYIECFSDVIKSSAQQFQEQGFGGTARVIETVADEAAGLARRLSSKGSRDLLREAESLARSYPAVFAGAVLLAGFGIARLLKSGSDEGMQSEEAYRGDGEYSGGTDEEEGYEPTEYTGGSA